MHEVGPPREKSTFWTRTATAETVNTHFVHSKVLCNTLHPTIVPLVLQRDCVASMSDIRALQPSPEYGHAHSQHILSELLARVLSEDAAAELELSCDPSTTQLKAAEIEYLDR